MRESLFFVVMIFLMFSCKDRQQCSNCSVIYTEKIEAYKNVFSNVEIFKIRYTSDSLEISGFIAKPENLTGKLPLIIYNRGGNRDYGAITIEHTRYLKYLSSLGYIVMATQYRGNSFSEGTDEFGGDDLNDIKCLIEIAKKTDYIDADNIGVLGYSRGGLMSYLLSKDSDEIKTLITVGAPTDMFLSSKNRPNLYNNVFYELVGDSINKKNDFIDRSPIYWANKLNEPILVIHGTNDEMVNIEHSKKLIDSLKKNPNKITHFFIENGNHSISNYKQIRNDTIANWFNYYLKGHNKK